MKIGQIASGLGLAVLGFSALACSSDDKGTGTGAQTGALSIQITAPANGASVDVSGSADVPVSLEITGFELKDPGRPDTGTNCPKGTCGHVHMLVDGTKCNDSGKPYNEAAVALTGNTIGLDYCPSINGPHTITAELHNDDHSPVLGADGKVITSNAVSITATGSTGNSEPDGG
jgi:hypothetical protein